MSLEHSSSPSVQLSKQNAVLPVGKDCEAMSGILAMFRLSPTADLVSLIYPYESEGSIKFSH